MDHILNNSEKPVPDSTDEADDVDDEKSAKHKLSDVLDMNTFDQILEMDEEGDNEFSSSIVIGFLEQAEETFVNMDKAL